MRNSATLTRMEEEEVAAPCMLAQIFIGTVFATFFGIIGDILMAGAASHLGRVSNILWISNEHYSFLQLRLLELQLEFLHRVHPMYKE